VTSGVRIGTPALTTRGMQEAEMVKIAGLIAKVVDSKGAEIENVRKAVTELASAFPLYPEL
jgi:glycine hydroxymethyltransferase